MKLTTHTIQCSVLLRGGPWQKFRAWDSFRGFYLANLLALVHILLATSGVRNASADSELPPLKPKHCIGYHSEKLAWGFSWLSLSSQHLESGETLDFLCPKHEGIFAVEDPSTSEPDSPFIILANCCPLPSESILLDEHVWEVDTCPENTIVTGFRRNRDNLYKVAALRCTSIDSSKFSLAPARPAAYWGIGRNMNTLLELEKLKRADIPLSIRYSVGRFAPFLWDDDGCVGSPIGSLLSGFQGRRCRDFMFRELLDHKGKPVIMYPDCASITDVFDPQARCIDRAGNELE